MNKIQKMISVITFGFMLFSAVPAFAGTTALGAACTTNGECASNKCTSGVCAAAGGATTGNITAEEVLPTPLGGYTGLGTADIRITIARVIRVAMSLLGIVAVVIILIGGFTWMTAGGNEEKVGEAKKWIFAGIIGLAIILSAYAISSFVINQLVTATTSNEQLPGA